MSHHLHRRETDPEPPPAPPPPITPEQLDWFTDQTERAAAKAARLVQRRAAVGFIVLLLGLSYVQWASSNQNVESRDAIVTSGKAVSVDGCNRDYEDRVQFIEVLLRGKAAVELSFQAGNSTQAQYEQGTRFYDQQLKEYKLIDCREAEEVLTSDPDKARIVPDPFYPGNPNAPSVNVPDNVEYTPIQKKKKDG